MSSWSSGLFQAISPELIKPVVGPKQNNSFKPNVNFCSCQAAVTPRFEISDYNIVKPPRSGLGNSLAAQSINGLKGCVGQRRYLNTWIKASQLDDAG
jgi:hypothetical protein